MSGDERELIFSRRDTRKCWIDFPSNARKLLTSKKRWRLLMWTRTTSWTSKNGGQTWSRKYYVLNAMSMPTRWGKFLLILDNEACQMLFVFMWKINSCLCGLFKYCFHISKPPRNRWAKQAAVEPMDLKEFFLCCPVILTVFSVVFCQETINIPVGTKMLIWINKVI